MKTDTNSKASGSFFRRMTFGPTAALLLIAALSLFHTTTARCSPANDTLISLYPGEQDVYPKPCNDTQCCYMFQLNVHKVTSEVDLTLNFNPGYSSDCMNADCWAAQSDSRATFTQTSAGHYKIVFSPALTPDTTLTIHLCGPYACMTAEWQNFSFKAFNGLTQVGKADSTQLYTCQTAAPCVGCNLMSINTSDPCFVTICITAQSYFVNGIDLNFTPPLQPCNISGPGAGGPCAGTMLTSPAGWSMSSPGSGSVPALHFLADSGNTLHSCETWCLNIPKCSITQAITVTATTSPFHNDCGANVSGSFKPVSGSAVMDPATNQNFPNPLNAASGFKTTIPFATSQAGEATVRLVNESGQEVYSDNMEVLGAGQHFFYVSGDKLPAGTYFYTIEFPKGIVVVSKSLLIVK